MTDNSAKQPTAQQGSGAQKPGANTSGATGFKEQVQNEVAVALARVLVQTVAHVAEPVAHEIGHGASAGLRSVASATGRAARSDVVHDTTVRLTAPVRERMPVFLKARRRMLVLGASGSGKTSFARSLSNALQKAIAREDRTESAAPVKAVLQRLPLILVDTPGGNHHAANRAHAVDRALDGRGFAGLLISVVCYGYLETNVEPTAALSPDGYVREDFLAQSREQERSILQEVLNRIRDTSQLKLLTVMNKADLWWERRHEVHQYYQEGEYHNLVSAYGLPHSVISYCSTMHRFFGELPAARTFDDDERLKRRQQLEATLVSLLSGPA